MEVEVWRIDVSELVRVKELEAENNQLKRVYANLAKLFLPESAHRESDSDRGWNDSVNNGGDGTNIAYPNVRSSHSFHLKYEFTRPINLTGVD